MKTKVKKMFEELRTLSFIINLEFLEINHMHTRFVDAKGYIY
jgi:hypothetical protein